MRKHSTQPNSIICHFIPPDKESVSTTKSHKKTHDASHLYFTKYIYNYIQSITVYLHNLFANFKLYQDSRAKLRKIKATPFLLSTKVNWFSFDISFCAKAGSSASSSEVWEITVFISHLKRFSCTACQPNH